MRPAGVEIEGRSNDSTPLPRRPRRSVRADVLELAGIGPAYSSVGRYAEKREVETPRLPCPITWDDQDRLFSQLPARLARMTLFAVNTGLRESNVCNLQWAWEVAVPEVGRSVFVVPPEAYKTRRAHVVILNDVAWSVIEEQRGEDAIWVFPYRGKPVGTMNNTAWQRARRKVGLSRVRIPDLRHTFAPWEGDVEPSALCAGH
jgi:integrase